MQALVVGDAAALSSPARSQASLLVSHTLCGTAASPPGQALCQNPCVRDEHFKRTNGSPQKMILSVPGHLCPWRQLDTVKTSPAKCVQQQGCCPHGEPGRGTSCPSEMGPSDSREAVETGTEQNSCTISIKASYAPAASWME